MKTNEHKLGLPSSRKSPDAPSSGTPVVTSKNLDAEDEDDRRMDKAIQTLEDLLKGKRRAAP